MDEKDWHMLKVIAEEKNVTRAAAHLYISQPALSYRLKNLEKELGTDLIVRNSSGIILTSEGEYLLSFAKKMLPELRKVKDHIQNMKGTVQGVLRLASSSVFAYYELPAILKGFQQLYPEVEFLLKTGRNDTVNQLLQKGEVPLAFIRGDYLWMEEKHLICEEPICLISSSSLNIRDLPNHSQITVSTAGIHNMVEEWWRQTFVVPPRIGMDVDNMNTCRQMVLHGLGWGIIPAIGLKGYDSIFRKELHWKNGEPLSRKTWLMCRTSSMELSAVRSFVEYIKSLDQFSSNREC
ncbi:MAG: LysR family transcriptional regulator [Veillonellales bacterium]